MSTKQKAIFDLNKKIHGATLIVVEGPCDFQVQLEAPEGHHWDGGPHCMALDNWFKGGWKRSEYWEYVISAINQLGGVTKCCDDKCEGIIAYGECDYWQ